MSGIYSTAIVLWAFMSQVLRDCKEASCQADLAVQRLATRKLVDGFTFKMPDTPKNQRDYPQHTAQKLGFGVPIARVTAVLSLSTGCLLAAKATKKGDNHFE